MTGSAGLVFHVLNRGVRRMRLFDKADDYNAFLSLFAEAQQRTPIRCLSYCLMPNHFHFVLWPVNDGDLSAFMLWLTTTHSKRWHVWHGTTGTGHVYQGRFKAVPVATDQHFLRLCHYVERNPVRAGLVQRADDWPWSSLAQRSGRIKGVALSAWPVPRPQDWAEMLNAERAQDAEEIRRSLRCRIPLGPDGWRIETAAALDLPTALNKGGRPRKPTPGVGFGSLV